MACASQGCNGGGCYNSDELPTTTTTTTTTTRLCYKCKTEQSINPSQTNNLCPTCFHTSLFSKFKQSIATQDLISPTDNILLAFSGGSASRVALQFVHELQSKALKNSDASRDKSYPVFGVGVAFVDESSAVSVPELDESVEEMREIVSSLSPPVKQLHVVPIENVFTENASDRLKELLGAVTDVTGREDFLQHLRMQCLQKIAVENKYTKLVLGTCTSRIACTVLSATVKGQGYSLPADMQYIDARWDIPVVLPLRDCPGQELRTLCQLNSLKTLDRLGCPHSGINGLVSSFITLLQEENPARERTIVRTAEKLIPFQFNKLPETIGSGDCLPRWRRKKLNVKLDESTPSEVLCPICSSPLNKSDLECLKSEVESSETIFKLFGVSCCSSCQFQILPKDMSSIEQFYSILPQHMITWKKDSFGGSQSWLRACIQDCLLSDGEDGT